MACKRDTEAGWVGVGLGSECAHGWAVGARRAVSQCCLVRLAAFLKYIVSKGWSAGLTWPTGSGWWMALSPQLLYALGKMFTPEDSKSIWNGTKRPCGSTCWASWDNAGCLPHLSCVWRACSAVSCFRNLLLPGQHHAQPCWVLCILEGCGEPLLGTTVNRLLWIRVPQCKSFCSLMTQTRSELNQQEPNTPQHQLSQRETVWKWWAPLPLPATRGSRRMPVLCLALSWILADGHAHPKHTVDWNWLFACSASNAREWWTCSLWLQLCWWMRAHWLFSVPWSLSSPSISPLESWRDTLVVYWELESLLQQGSAVTRVKPHCSPFPSVHPCVSHPWAQGAGKWCLVPAPLSVLSSGRSGGWWELCEVGLQSSLVLFPADVRTQEVTCSQVC